MSAALSRPPVSASGDEAPDSHELERPVVVRRNAALAAVIGAAASAVAIAYLWRASQTGAVLDWALCAVMAAIAVLYLANLVDARTPLLVADHLGVRIRLGNQWRGLPWDAVGQVRIVPRRGLVRDGRLAFSPHSMARALEGLDARGRRAAALNQRMYGAALAVPMGLTTRISGADTPDALSESIAALAEGRTDVLVVLPDPAPGAVEVEPGRDVVDPGQVRDEPGQVRDEPGQVLDEPGQVGDEPGPAPLEPGFVRDVLASRVFRRPARPVDEPTDENRDETDDLDGAAGTEDEPQVVEASWTEDTVPVHVGVVRQARPTHDDEGQTFEIAADRDGLGAEVVAEDADDDREDTPEAPVRRSPLGGLATIVSRFARGRGHDLDRDETPVVEDDAPVVEDDAPAAPQVPAARETSVPLARSARRGLRAQVTRDEPATVLGNAALLPGDDAFGRRSTLPEGDALRRIGDDDLPFLTSSRDGRRARPDSSHDTGRVRPISTLGDPVEPLVIDDFQTEPAYDPVIGPELAAARTRVGLTVDELAERTRIRPHVIESIEVDDFAPCGGDFYARGHLRTLCRVLGKDPVPLLAQFDQRYATAPINARRVFEAELATGMTGSMRATRGGPNWTLLIGVVLVLVLTWGVIRLFAAEPQELLQPSGPVLNGSAGLAGEAVAPTRDVAAAPVPAAKPVKVMLVGAQGDSDVVVRDGDRAVVWAGEIVLGEKRVVKATPPVTVRAKDGGAIEVRLNGRSRGVLGEPDQPARQTFGRPGSAEAGPTR